MNIAAVMAMAFAVTACTTANPAPFPSPEIRIPTPEDQIRKGCPARMLAGAYRNIASVLTHTPDDRIAYLAAIRILVPLQKDLALLPEFRLLAKNYEESLDLLVKMQDQLSLLPHKNDLQLLLAHLQKSQTLADRMSACKNSLDPS